MALRVLKKYSDFSIFLGLELLLFLLVSYQIQVTPHVSLLEKLGLSIFGPIQRLNHYTLSALVDSFAEKKTVRELEARIQVLEQRLVDQHQLQARQREVELQNKRLRDLLDLPQPEQWRHIYAEIIGRSRRYQDNLIFINKGSRHGVRRDYGVLSKEGVVGIVWEVTAQYAKIMTLNNPGTVVAVRPQESRYSESFVVGQGFQKGRLENFPNYEEIAPRDLVLTSGLDRVFPEGLHVGQVLSAAPSDYAFQNVTIEFSSKLFQLEEVIVLEPLAQEGVHELE